MKKKSTVSRRGFFKSTIAGAAALSAARYLTLPAMAKGVEEAAGQETPGYGDYLKDRELGDQKLPITEDNIEGPFFRPDAPLREVLYEKGTKGDKYVVSGAVKARNGRPLKGAWIEIWQADAKGRYDNDDPRNRPGEDEFVLRGRVRTDEKGEYRFETIRPAQYQISRTQFRPAHIHIKVHQKGYVSLTTQLYFEDDPINASDPWFKKSLIVKYEKKKSGKFEGSFRFVLPKKNREK